MLVPIAVFAATQHPDASGFYSAVVGVGATFVVAWAIVLGPSWPGYNATNREVLPWIMFAGLGGLVTCGVAAWGLVGLARGAAVPDILTQHLGGQVLDGHQLESESSAGASALISIWAFLMAEFALLVSAYVYGRRVAARTHSY